MNILSNAKKNDSLFYFFLLMFYLFFTYVFLVHLLLFADLKNIKYIDYYEISKIKFINLKSGFPKHFFRNVEM